MKCPIDQADLVMTDRQGIEIDYCPSCRGVWLDRGELDKIIRAAPSAPVQAQTPRNDNRREDRDDDRRDDNWRDGRDDRRRYDDRDRDDRYRGKPYKKRESFLSDIFDF